MELTIYSTGKYVEEKVVRDHYWYDHVNRKMLHGKGGRMEFRYDPIEKRAVPVLVDHFEKVRSTNISDIGKWLQTNAADFGVEVTERNGDRSITVSVSPTRLGDVIDDLHRVGISCDYDGDELHKELKGLRWPS
jgi:hypothetical protein